ncbi:MAG: hypothetical protein ACI8RD_009131 [Bacillariaceae sp.]|jgi:hypothetical protein
MSFNHRFNPNRSYLNPLVVYRYDNNNNSSNKELKQE